MKERVREAAFNLIGERVRHAIVLDLFSGTGALALEALSRGAARAICIERHFPTADLILHNARELDLAQRVSVHPGDTFAWWKLQQRQTTIGTQSSWLVFCSPPYILYQQRETELLEMLSGLWQLAPGSSTFVVEFEISWDPTRLPGTGWDVRPYPPAVLAVKVKSDDPDDDPDTSGRDSLIPNLPT